MPVDSLGCFDNREFLDDSVDMWPMFDFDMGLDLPRVHEPLDRPAIDLVASSKVWFFGPRVAKPHIDGCYSLQLPPKRAERITRHTSIP